MASTQSVMNDRSQSIHADNSRTNGRDGQSAGFEEGRSSEEIRTDIDRTRGEMDSTLERLGEQLKPRRLFESFMHAMGSSGDGGRANDYAEVAGRIGKKAIRQAERHPIPALLFGAGLAWLLYEEFGSSEDEADFDRLTYGRSYRDLRARRDYEPSYYDPSYSDPSYDDPRYDEDFDDAYEPFESRRRRAEPSMASKVGEKIGDAAGAVKDTAQSVVAKVKGAGERSAGAASGAAESASETLSDMGQSARHAARDMSRTARRIRKGAARSTRSMARGSQRLARRAGHGAEAIGSSVADRAQTTIRSGKEGFEHAVEDYPLAVGVGFAALGILAGLAMPSTRYEDEWMGEAADEIKHTAKRKGEEVLERGKKTVESAVSTLKEEAQSQGIMPGDLQQKAKHVLAEAVDSAKETVKNEVSLEGLKNKAKNVAEAVGSQVKQDAKLHKDEMLTAAKQEGAATPPLVRPAEEI
jgi:hypothetical protein